MREKKVYAKGEWIIREGSVQRDAYIIEKGTVEVFRQDENGNKKVIAVLGKQEVFGEMTLLEGGTRCAHYRPGGLRTQRFIVSKFQRYSGYQPRGNSS